MSSSAKPPQKYFPRSRVRVIEPQLAIAVCRNRDRWTLRKHDRLVIKDKKLGRQVDKPQSGLYSETGSKTLGITPHDARIADRR